MSSYRIEDVARCTGARVVHGDVARAASGISTDTRSLARGDLFVALSGPNYDGNRFAADALARGAAGVMLEDAAGAPPAARDLPRDTPLLLHPAPRRALSDIARWHRGRLSAHVIGITGSCGKTTTKSILIDLLASRRRTVGSPNSFNNDVGVPHTLFLADESTEAVVVEMGTNAPGEIASLCRTAAPTAGIITNVGAAHLEGLGSLQGVAREKSALAESLPADGFCVLNADCRWTRTMRGLTPARVITFSVEGEGDLDASDVWFHPGGTTFRLEGLEITSPLLGLHNVQNLLAALAACRGLSIPLEEVLPAVSRLKAARRRLERIQLDGMTLIDDSYNANPESARASVRVLAGLHGHARRVLVLGDMLELGPLAAELHHEIGLEAARSGIDLVVLVGELTRASAAGAIEGGLDENRVVHVDTTEEAIERIGDLVRPGDVVLVKGSRRTGLERVVAHLTERRRQSVA